MNTEQLQSRHLEAIEKIQPYKKGSIEQVASACTLITIEEMKGFAEFSTGYHSFGDVTWRNKSGGITLTFDELINLYLNRKQ
jgi:hypothetical protein